MRNICSVDGCNIVSHGYGLCSNHYQMKKRNGSPYVRQRIERKGYTKMPEYRVWNTMKYRCSNPNSEMYPRYGGRGISVCEEWRNSFLAFIKDMGRRPSYKHQIDRIDNDGNYCPENCRWVLPRENRINQEPRLITTEMKELFIKDRESGLSYEKIGKKRGFSTSGVYNAIHRAVTY